MIPRVVVPTNAQIGEQPVMPSGIGKAHLVPRRLIPADAKLTAIREAPSPYGKKPREMMVRKVLVPEGARMGMVVTSCAPDGHRRTGRKLFDEAFVNEGVLGHKRGAREWLISFGIHGVIVAVVMIQPFFLTPAIDPYKLELTHLIATPVTPAPPPATTPALQRPISKRVVPVIAKLTMPVTIPKIIPKVTENEVPEAPPEVVASLAGGVTGGLPGGQIGGVLDGILGGAAISPSAPLPVAAAPDPGGPLHLGGEVKPPRKIYAPEPQYPILAQQARIQGVVKIDAIIDKDGNVVKEQVMSGPALLIAAALEAVKGWKYQPTYLNGVAWPIEITINVSFSLSGKAK